MENVDHTIQMEQLYEMKKKRTTHVLHFLISFFTVSLWIPVWVLIAVNNGIENQRLRKRLGL